MKKPNYGRKPVIRSLPPLEEACSEFTGFQGGERRAERIYAVLEKVIQRNRRATLQPFYAMRDVAAFFGASLHTVSLVYRRLSHEGVLTRMRSSQTMIAARAPRPRLTVRGVVCMPIYLTSFLHFQHWRNLFSELEEELSRHRFVLEPVFFQFREQIEPAFVERVLKFNPDYVVWLAPSPGDRMTMESLIDAGVPMLSIMGEKISALPGRIYRTRNDRALSQGLKEWKASGKIDQFVIPCIKGGHVGVMEDFRSALQASPLPYQFKPYHLDSVSEYLASLAPNQRTGIFFGDPMHLIRLCGSATEKMFQLFRRHRVIFSCQVMMQSWTMPTDIFVDWLAVPTRRLARRIAEDLSQFKGALPSSEEVFEVEWRPRTPLAELARYYRSE